MLQRRRSPLITAPPGFAARLTEWRALIGLLGAGLATCSPSGRPGVQGPPGNAGGGGSLVDSGDARGEGGPAALPLLHPTEIQYLSGHGSDDAVAWDFYCASAVATNRNCTGSATGGNWTTIPVPSNWELQGFGTYYYGTDNNFLRGPQETGFYRLNFSVPPAWSGKRVLIVFEGSMTDTDVKINGVSAGPTHRGAFYRFQYDVSALLKFDAANLLEVAVAKESANASVSAAERSADYWVFGGIFRPVSLEAYPPQSVDRFAVDARADGNLKVDVTLQQVSADAVVKAQVFDARAEAIGPTLTAPVTMGQTAVSLTGLIADIAPWSAESPNVYRLEVTLEQEGAPVHQVVDTFGFRTVEVRPGNGVYVNGKRVMLRGINRHSFWPSTGRALNATISRDDIALLKGMNVNAVRSSHYPPDRHFLDAADAAGLYVLDELAGWQHAYDTPSGGPLLREMVTHDVNHPSILFWDNGNEGGWNTDLDAGFKQLDPQGRAVLHPQQFSGGILASHYPNYAAAQASLAGSNVFMPTEFLHGLYDGGGGAGLDDYWTLMRGSPVSAGGFLWAFLDEGVVRTDDPQKRIDTKGNQAPDGIVGPYREKEGSYDTIREVWSPAQITLNQLPDSFNVENRYDFTDLNSVLFHWQLVDFDFRSAGAGHRVIAEGAGTTGSISPGATGPLSLVGVPADWSEHHALLIAATDGTGTTIGQWSWMLATAGQLRQSLVTTTGDAVAGCSGSTTSNVTVTAGAVSYSFNPSSGLLAAVSRGASNISFQNGPVLTTGSGATLSAANGAVQSFDVAQQGNDCVLTATFDGNPSQVLWQVMASGWLRLTYRYSLTGSYDFFGVNFDYPEANVRGVQWLGKGPYRVWKNRLRGTTFDVYARDYNDAVTGGTWIYPEFKGYFADVRWARLLTSEGTIHFVFDSDNTFLRLYRARDGASPQTTQMTFPPPSAPAGAPGISFLQGIPAIGTKFDMPSALGPQSQPYVLDGSLSEETVYLFFGDLGDLP